MVRGFAHGSMGPIELFLDQQVLNNCGMVLIKDPLLLIEMSSPCSGGRWFSLAI